MSGVSSTSSVPIVSPHDPSVSITQTSGGPGHGLVSPAHLLYIACCWSGQVLLNIIQQQESSIFENMTNITLVVLGVEYDLYLYF